MLNYKHLCSILVLILIAGCNDDSESSNLKEPAREGDGRVICYNNDGTEFFNNVGSRVNIYNGITQFRHLKTNPDYSKGYIYFSPAWKCIVEDW